MFYKLQNDREKREKSKKRDSERNSGISGTDMVRRTKQITEKGYGEVDR